MTSRRVPLANLPNAANSPYRDTVAPGTKRARSHAGDQRELAYAQPPPAKKQILEANDEETRQHTLLRKAGHNPPTALQKRLEAVRDARTASRGADKTQKASHENLESIRQWQRHYKKVFPQIVFYYESVPDDVRAKISRRVQTLGAREEVFFSRTVSHVVTTRPIPPELTSSSSTGRSPQKDSRNGQANTINPLLLETQQTRGKFPFDVAKKNQPLQPNDILYKARELGIKIWSLEKLERMLTTMFNNETGEAPTQTYPLRGGAALAQTKTKADLSQLLQKEKLYGQATQDWAVDMAPFRGYYVYIHDMDEQTRPVMIRDYPKPTRKEEGKWPQLRVNASGRCPFLDDPSAKQPVPRPEQAPRTRAAAAREAPPADRRALTENNNLARHARAVSTQPDDLVKPLDPPKSIPLKRGSTDNLPLYGSAQASLRRHPRFAGGEPVASGVQPSNVTSAIRSQMISSTAAVPGAKVGASKELHRLNRRVFERSTIPSANSMPSSYLNDVRAAINNDPVAAGRATKRKVDDALGHIQEEDIVLSEEEERPRRVVAAKRKKAVEKELKPGYCENCRAKFNDFDEHVVSRTHKKFATTAENWAELDQLLDQLIRPYKDE